METCRSFHAIYCVFALVSDIMVVSAIVYARGLSLFSMSAIYKLTLLCYLGDNLTFPIFFEKSVKHLCISVD